MITFIFTKEKAWLDKWDHFVSHHPKGSHLMYSEWLKSYTSYGFDFEIGLVLDHGQIAGGYGAVIPKFLLFKFYIIPHGPIYNNHHQGYLEDHVLQVKSRAKTVGACYMQLSIPISSNKNISDYVYQKDITDALKELLKPGKQFSYVYSSYGINWVDLKAFDNSEQFLEQLTPKVRRNIRMPYNKGAVASFVNDIGRIEKGYQVIIENAEQGGYSVRAFSEFKSTIVELIAKKQAYFIVCEVANEIKAAGFFVRNAGYITNITGGVLREKPDIKLGYMLQWEMIKKSFELGLQGYNISMGGSSGVRDFKTKFGAEAISFEDSHYHLVLNTFWFFMYSKIGNNLRPFKKQISKILSFFNR